jgi:hypothetical protein
MMRLLKPWPKEVIGKGLNFQPLFKLLLMKRKLFILAGSVLIMALILIAYAIIRTWGKTDLDVKIHINEELVQKSGFGESPTFAVWLENPESHEIRAVYITRRAAEGDWEGKNDVPVALPRWFEIQKKLQEAASQQISVDAFSGATPKPGYFTTKASLAPDSKWICWIEVNLAADYNEYYVASHNQESETDKYLSGQPAILYRAEIMAKEGVIAESKLVGITVYNAPDGKVIQPLQGITTSK